MRSKKNRLVAFTMMVLLVAYSCNNIPDCRNEIPLNALLLKFYSKSNSELTRIKFDSIKALNTDSIFYLGDSISTYALILDPSLDQSTFLFYTENSAESLTVSYARNISIISEECGPAVLFSDIQIEEYSFDSTALTNNFLDQSISENIEIYF